MLYWGYYPIMFQEQCYLILLDPLKNIYQININLHCHTLAPIEYSSIDQVAR